MKKLFKWMLRLLIVLVVLLGILVLCLDPIAKSLAERQIRRQTGMEPRIGKVSVGLKSPVIIVQKLKLLNPPEFGGGSFLDVPELYLAYDRRGLLERKIHLTLLRINLEELHIVQNKSGKSNLQWLQQRSKPSPSETRSGSSGMEFQGIDAVTLSLGRLRYTCLTNMTLNQELWAGVRTQTVNNVKTFKDLEPLLIRIALEKSAQFLLDQVSHLSSTNLLEKASRPPEPEAPRSLENTTEPVRKKPADE